MTVAGANVASVLVQEEQIDVIGAQALKRLLDGGIALVGRGPDLRLQEDILASL